MNGEKIQNVSGEGKENRGREEREIKRRIYILFRQRVSRISLKEEIVE